MIRLARRVQLLHGERFVVDPRWRSCLGRLGIAEGLDWPGLVPGEPVSSSPTTKCFRVRLEDGATVFFKRYVYPRALSLKYWMRPSRAAVEVYGFGVLNDLGIPAAEPLAFGEIRFMGALLSAFVVTRGVDGAVDLATFARDTWLSMEKGSRRQVGRQIAESLLEQVRCAHQARFFHHDLKWRNILLRECAGSYTPIWIDCPRASRKRLRWRRGVMVDLSGLARQAVRYLSVYEQYRLLRRYTGDSGSRGQTRRWFLRIRAHLLRRPSKSVGGGAAGAP